MNKKANTLLFILAATVFNILITVIFFVALFALDVSVVAPLIPENGRAWGFPIIFLGSLAISFVVYRLALKLFIKKVNVEKYFDPILKGRK